MRNERGKRALLQPDFVQTIEAWGLTLLLYPGVAFAVLLALLGEWLSATVRPLLGPRPSRGPTRLYSFIEPLYTYLKLLGRRAAVRWQRPDDPAVALSHPGETALAVVGAVAPLLALCLLPLRGSPIARPLGQVGDLVLVLMLLAVQPVTWAVLRLREGGTAALRGAQDLGRLLTGLVPLLLLVAALVQASGSGSLRLSGLLPAPETPQQTLVRLLAGVGLLLVLPWWTAWGRDASPAQWSASAYAGRFVQTVALSAFWTVLVLPTPGDLPWAVALMTVGTLFAYVTTRLLAERWAPARRESEATALLWATAVPLSLLALLVAFWHTA